MGFCLKIGKWWSSCIQSFWWTDKLKGGEIIDVLTVRTFRTNCWQGGMLLRSRLKTASENANEFRYNNNYVPKFFHKQPNLTKSTENCDIYWLWQRWILWYRGCNSLNNDLTRRRENGNSFEQVTELGQALKIVSLKLSSLKMMFNK